MAKAKKTEPVSETERLYSMLELYAKVLHPDFFNQLKFQISKAITEQTTKIQETARKEKGISETALELDKIYISTLEKMKRYGHDPGIKKFLIKCAFKDVLKTFENNNIEPHGQYTG